MALLVQQFCGGFFLAEFVTGYYKTKKTVSSSGIRVTLGVFQVLDACGVQITFNIFFLQYLLTEVKGILPDHPEFF